MFLFRKKTKNVIKWVWGVFASLIILSMVATYSGFTGLARETQQQAASQQVPPDVLAKLAQQQASGTPTTLDTQNASNSPVTLDQATLERLTGSSSTAPTTQQPAAPPPKPLNFSL